MFSERRFRSKVFAFGLRAPQARMHSGLGFFFGPSEGRGMTGTDRFRPIDVAREILPGLSDDELDCVLWEHTGFPEWWDFRPGETNYDVLRRQLVEYRDVVAVERESEARSQTPGGST